MTMFASALHKFKMKELTKKSLHGQHVKTIVLATANCVQSRCIWQTSLHSGSETKVL